MNVERKEVPPEPVKPVVTYDITGLTPREAGALKALILRRIGWSDQEEELARFFHDLYSDIEAPEVRLNFRDDEY